MRKLLRVDLSCSTTTSCSRSTHSTRPTSTTHRRTPSPGRHDHHVQPRADRVSASASWPTPCWPSQRSTELQSAADLGSPPAAKATNKTPLGLTRELHRAIRTARHIKRFENLHDFSVSLGKRQPPFGSLRSVSNPGANPAEGPPSVDAQQEPGENSCPPTGESRVRQRGTSMSTIGTFRCPVSAVSR